VPHQLVEQLYRDTGVRTAPLRGISWTANKLAVETFIDEIAVKRGTDPVAYRLELIKDPRARRVVETVAGMADWGRKRDGRGMGFAFLNYSDSLVAGAAEVSLERSTGEVTLHNFWCALDCGIAVQPDNVAAQTESSIVYGLGLALMERITIKDGAVQQSNILDYGVPRMHDIPELHVKLMSTPNRPTGAGQMATPIVAPAIASAVFAANGARVRHIPFLPERVLAAIS